MASAICCPLLRASRGDIWPGDSFVHQGLETSYKIVDKLALDGQIVFGRVISRIVHGVYFDKGPKLELLSWES